MTSDNCSPASNLKRRLHRRGVGFALSASFLLSPLWAADEVPVSPTAPAPAEAAPAVPAPVAPPAAASSGVAPAFIAPPLQNAPERDPVEGPDITLDEPPAMPPPASVQGGRGSSVVDFIEPSRESTSEALGETQNPRRIRLLPIFEITATFDDNIFISQHNKEADLYHSVLAGAAVGFGEFRDSLNALGRFQQGYEGLRSPEFDDRKYAFVSYTPGATIFASHSGENTFDQVAQAGAKWEFGRLTTSFSGDFRQFSEAYVDSQSREQVSRLKFELAAKYALTGKTSLEIDLYQFSQLFDNQVRIDSREWIDQNYINYQISPKLRLGVGLRLGYLELSQGSSQTYEQGVVRFFYDTQNKLKVSLFGGVEFRQLGGGEDRTNPIFGFDAYYTPRPSTLISLSSVRQVTNSIYFAEENVTSSRIWASWAQGLFQKTTLTLSAGFENREYDDPRGFGNAGRTDNAITASAEYAFHVTKWTAISFIYNYWHSDSTSESFNFTDNRVSVRFDLLF